MWKRDVHYHFILRVSNKKSKKNSYKSRGIKQFICGWLKHLERNLSLGLIAHTKMLLSQSCH